MIRYPLGYPDIAKELLADWRQLAEPDLAKVVSKTLRGHLDDFAHFVAKDEWMKAQDCCEAAGESAATARSPYRPLPQAKPWAEGIVEYYFGINFLAQDRVEVALQQFISSVDKFRTNPGFGCWTSAATLWFSIGKVYRLNCRWKDALNALQFGLDALEHAPRNVRSQTLKAKIEEEHRLAREGRHDEVETRKPAPPKSVTPVPAASSYSANIWTIPVIRKIAAGDPTWTGEAVCHANVNDPNNIITSVSVDASLVKEHDIGWLVAGESMTEAGILDGDVVFIRPVNDNRANNGEIVIVAIHAPGEEPEGTLKQYYREANHHRLEPKNPAFRTMLVIPPGEDRRAIEAEYRARGIRFTSRIGEAQIVGKLVAVLRKTA